MLQRMTEPSAHRISRCAAVLGATAAVLHVPLAVAHAGSSPLLALALLLMSLVCLPCAGHLWRAPSRRTWLLVAVAGAAMLVAHAVLLVLPGGSEPRGLPVAGHAGHSTGIGLGFTHSAGWLVLVSALTAVQVVTAVGMLRGAEARVRAWRA